MGLVLQELHRLTVMRCVLVGWLIPSLAIAGPSTKATVRVEIDVSALEAFDAGGIEQDIRARTEPILDDRRYFLDDASPDSVVVRVEYVDKKDLEYGIHIFVYDDGNQVEPRDEWVVCKYCPHSMVAERFAERLPGALARLEASNAGVELPADDEPAEDGRVENEPVGDPESRPDEVSTPPPSRAIGWLGVSGAFVAAGGLGMGGFGLARLVRGTEVRGADAERTQTYDYPAQGRLFLGLGVGAFALGAAALVADVVVRRRSRRTVSASPTASNSSIGLAINGRF